MVSINSFSTVTAGSVEGRSNTAQTEEKLQSAQIEARRTEEAAVASVPSRDERFLRDPDAATALANSIALRLSNIDFEQAIDLQANSRSADVKALLS